MDKFRRLFKVSRAVVIAMVHVRALPGSPGNSLTVNKISEMACKEAKVYQAAGVDAIMLENMHDLPYLQTDAVGPEITAAMTAISCEIRRVCRDVPCGIQVLSGANKQAIAVAQAAGLDFIRAEGFVYSHIADEGLMNACAGELLRYRRFIGAENVLIFTDIKKKHSSHSITSDLSISEVAEGAQFFGSDGVVVTGGATGVPTNLTEVKSVSECVNIPVLVGSGVTVDNLSSYLFANALIVGSHFKRDGKWQNEVEAERVWQFMKQVKELR